VPSAVRTAKSIRIWQALSAVGTERDSRMIKASTQLRNRKSANSRFGRFRLSTQGAPRQINLSLLRAVLAGLISPER